MTTKCTGRAGTIPTSAFWYSDSDATARWNDDNGKEQHIAAREGFVLRFHVDDAFTVSWREVIRDA